MSAALERQLRECKLENRALRTALVIFGLRSRDANPLELYRLCEEAVQEIKAQEAAKAKAAGRTQRNRKDRKREGKNARRK